MNENELIDQENLKCNWLKTTFIQTNKIRRENSEALIAKGEEPLEPYVFDYLLLCNKICGASHYNMQMKIIVETPQEFEKWMTDQQTFAEFIQ